MSGFYDDASWLLIPEGIEEDIVFAQKPISGLGDLTFTRASDATRTNSAGVIERTPWNLLQFSEQFSNGVWSKINATIGIDASLAPNGTLTADKLIPNNGVTPTAADSSLTLQPLALKADVYTFSIYAKAAEFTSIRFRDITFSGQLLTVNLTNGAITGGGNQFNSPSAVNVGNGWYRISFTSNSINLMTNASQYAIRCAETGNGTSGIFIWGAQLVEGTAAKPYFATTNRQDVPRLDYRNADGSLNSCPRLLLEPPRANSIRNSTMVGAVAGSPGTLPTNWVAASSAGLTRTIVAIGTENGLPYIDLRFNGTANATDIRTDLEGGTATAAATGQTWAYSLYSKVISGAAPVSTFVFFERNSIGTIVTSGSSSFSPTSTLTRFTGVRTLSGGITVAFLQPSLSFTLINGATYDFTIRIAAPQMELGAYATTWVPTTTAAVTRLGDTFLRNNLFTNGILTAAGGTWFFDLNNTAQFGRSNSNFALFLSTIDNGFGGNGFVLYNTGSPSQRLTVAKYVNGGISTLYTLSSDATRFAIKWNGTTADFFENGVKVISATAFTATALQFIGNQSLPVPININQSALFPTPLTDAQCIQITT
jgi:hypothetical protein